MVHHRAALGVSLAAAARPRRRDPIRPVAANHNPGVHTAVCEIRPAVKPDPAAPALLSEAHRLVYLERGRHRSVEFHVEDISLAFLTLRLKICATPMRFCRVSPWHVRKTVCETNPSLRRQVSTLQTGPDDQTVGGGMENVETKERENAREVWKGWLELRKYSKDGKPTYARASTNACTHVHAYA